ALPVADGVAALVILELGVAKEGEAIAPGLAFVRAALVVGLVSEQVAGRVELELLLNITFDLGQALQRIVVETCIAFFEVLDERQRPLGVVAIVALDQGRLALSMDHTMALQPAGRVVLELAEQAALLAGDFPAQGIALQAHEQGVVPVDAVVLAEAVVVIAQYLAIWQCGFYAVADGIVGVLDRLAALAFFQQVALWIVGEGKRRYGILCGRQAPEWVVAELGGVAIGVGALEQTSQRVALKAGDQGCVLILLAPALDLLDQLARRIIAVLLAPAIKADFLDQALVLVIGELVTLSLFVDQANQVALAIVLVGKDLTQRVDLTAHLGQAVVFIAGRAAGGIGDAGGAASFVINDLD